MEGKTQERARRGKSTKRLDAKIAKAEYRKAGYQSTVNEIGVLRSSDVIYNVNTNYTSNTSGGEARYAGTNSEGRIIIDVNVSQTYLAAGGLAHELVHAYQFETGQIDFQSTGGPGLLYDLTDEIVAFGRQLMFTGNSDMYKVSGDWVRKRTNQSGTKLYDELPNGPLNVNSTHYQIEYQHFGKLDLSKNLPYRNLNVGYTPIYR